MAQTVTQIPSRGEHTDLEPCRSCGTALVADQRYCLACGARRGPTRVPVSALFIPVDAAAPVASRSAPPAPLGGRPVITPTLAAIAAAAVVLALVAGLLIGRGENGTVAAPAAAPVKVSVSGGGTGADTTASADVASRSKTRSSKSRHRKSSKLAKAPKASLTSKGQKVGTADKGTLNALQNTSGKDYSKKSANLPTTTVLPGKAPPKDNKKAGGGSKEVTIG